MCEWHYTIAEFYGDRGATNVARGLPSRWVHPAQQPAEEERNEHMHPHSAKLALLTIVTLALLATSPLGAGERLAMRVSPRMAFAPATVVVDAVAERDPANRALQIQVDSPEYYRSSLMQLDGDQAPRTTTVRYEGVPGGMYEVRVVLFGSDGRQLAATSRQVQILSVMGR